MEKLQTIWTFVRRHKYAVVTIFFLCIIGVFDENSLMRRAVHKREIATLKEEIKHYTLRYEEDTRKLNELNSNPEAIEKIAREKYLMKEADEDVFIFEE
ncbi:MAG: septum formation initiator family protein [Bacteroidaceae bacterium]|nr:septum formation initiator family protein [Bacteroidaceae bacterium]